MTIELVQKDILDISCDLLVVNVFQGVTKPGGAAGALDKALGGAISDLITQDKFEGKLGQALAFPTFKKIKAKRVAVIGLGNRKKFDADAVRKIGGHIVKLAEKCGASSVVTILHGAGLPVGRQASGGLEPRAAAQALAEGLQLSAYRFHAYHGTLRKKEKKKEVKSMIVAELEPRTAKLAEEGIRRGNLLAAATCYARDLVNTPSSEMTPARLAEEARKLAGGGVSVKVMDQQEMERRGMRAALAVARGSTHPPYAVHLTYRPIGAKKTVAIVGKAVTFDSGGLSLKPANAMETMKIDMAGAAAVLGLFKALKELRLPVAVHGVFLAVENMPGGGAYRPGDVVKAMDGTTIEVLNTDAEGRVTLADALAYARALKPDTIVDLATLTGACVVALGEDIAGVFSPNAKLANRLLVAAGEGGEPMWELPLHEPYAELIKSKIADLKNTGGGHGAGAITAALFLKPFVGDIPWAHIDIAGPSYTERETRPDVPYGGSGYGVRTLVRFLQKL